MASAIATAVRRLPTPAGPASSSDGGSVSRAIARESSATRRRWPMIEREGHRADAYRERSVARNLAPLGLARSSDSRSSAAEDARPEAASSSAAPSARCRRRRRGLRRRRGRPRRLRPARRCRGPGCRGPAWRMRVRSGRTDGRRLPASDACATSHESGSTRPARCRATKILGVDLDCWLAVAVARRRPRRRGSRRSPACRSAADRRRGHRLRGAEPFRLVALGRRRHEAAPERHGELARRSRCR